MEHKQACYCHFISSLHLYFHINLLTANTPQSQPNVITG